MLKLVLIAIFVSLLNVLLVNGDHLTVNTKTGPVVGVAQESFLNKVPYISYKGIPYAEPPINKLRFKVPSPIKPWTELLVTTDKYKPSCFWFGETKLAALPTNQSEDCLYLNIYTPVMDEIKINKKLPVLFFIHGGGNSWGDGSDLTYGPDFIVEDNIILVTINYRLGAFGCTNFEMPGYTGNMGLKDQQMAMQWIHNNIISFGGDPDSITIFGESSGATAVHLFLLSDSCEFFKRAIMWSGTAFNAWMSYEKNNHLDRLKEAFKSELGNNTSTEDLFNFMIDAPSDVIAQKRLTKKFNGFFESIWTEVIENKSIAVDPFLTENPYDIYAKNQFSSHCKSVEVLFGTTSAEYLTSYDSSDLYGWIEPLKNNSNIGLPYFGLNIRREDEEYQSMLYDIKNFYFGEGEIEQNVDRLNQFIQMNSDINYLPPFYEAMRLHSNVSPTFCNFFNISLNTNIVKLPRDLEMVEGMGHFEDIHYMFKAKKFADLYSEVYNNRKNNVTDQKTVDAWQFVTKLFTDFAKNGSLEHSTAVKSNENVHCVEITNDGLRSIIQPKEEAIKFWDQIGEKVKLHM